MVLKNDILSGIKWLPLTASIHKIKTKQKNMSGIHVYVVAPDSSVWRVGVFFCPFIVHEIIDVSCCVTIFHAKDFRSNSLKTFK